MYKYIHMYVCILMYMNAHIKCRSEVLHLGSPYPGPWILAQPTHPQLAARGNFTRTCNHVEPVLPIFARWWRPNFLRDLAGRNRFLFWRKHHIFGISVTMCSFCELSPVGDGRVFWTDWLCCSVLQCVAVCCSVLQCVAVCCSVLQCAAVCCSVLQCVAVCCSVLHHQQLPATKR